MTETLLLIILIVLYLGSFIGRSLLVKKRLKKPIRSKEEKHLLCLHGTDYNAYKKKTGRYLPRIGRQQ